MRRRDFMAGLSAAAAWPLVARAQQQAMPVIGYLSILSSGASAPYRAAFLDGLKEAGFVEGHNVAIEYRWAEGQYDRLPALAAELVGRPVAVIVTVGGAVPARAAKAATNKIPIVFSSGGDVTGVSFIASALTAKRLELLHQLVPNATVIGVLVNPKYIDANLQRRELQEAAETIGQQTLVVGASTDRDIETAFATLVQGGIDALLVANDPFFFDRRDQIVLMAARHALPAIYFVREFVTAGGLMSYGARITNAHREVGIYTGKILKSAKPDELPVIQPTTYEMVINSKTAKALGLDIPPSLLARADEVIE